MSDILHTLNFKISRGWYSLNLSHDCNSSFHGTALDPPMVHQVLRACMAGLDDYTTDERGDVGSWIRMACIRGLCLTAEVLFDICSSLQASGSLQTWLPPQTYQGAIGGILKQGVERLDNVRRQAGVFFLRLLRRGSPNIDEGGRWEVQGHALMELLFLRYGDVNLRFKPCSLTYVAETRK